MPKGKVLILFLIISLVNCAIYFYRDHFQYHPFASYNKLYSKCDKACEEKWRLFTSPYPQNELIEAGSLAATFGDGSSELSKIESISKQLFQKFNAQIGKPDEAIKTSSPLKVYSFLLANKSRQLECGQFAQMFSFFCWSQQIICRNIEIMREGDHHVVNECYVRELGQWVLIDLTNGFFLPKSKGEYLNVQTFLKGLEDNKPIETNTLKRDSIVLVDLRNSFPDVAYYYKAKYPYYYYHVTNTPSVYKGLQKLKRYVLPVSWYEIYDEEGKGNFLFYLKDVLIIIWIILLSLTLISYRNAND